MGMVGLVRPPDRAQELGCRHDLSGVGDQHRQQPVLRRRQAHGVAALGHAPAPYVHHHVAEAHFSIAAGYQFSPRDSLTLRTDILDDTTGQRTGFKTRYYDAGLGWEHWIGKAITLHPELRWEHSRDVDAHDNPTATLGAGKRIQKMVAIDVIVHI
jgi:hypothetical protein